MFNGMAHRAADGNIRFITGVNDYVAQESGPAQYGSVPGGWPHPAYPAPGGHVPPAAPHGYDHPPGPGGAALDPALQRIFELIDNRLTSSLQAVEAHLRTVDARLRAVEAQLSAGSAGPSADQREERDEPPPLPRRPADRRGPALAGLDREPRPHPSDWDRRSMATDDLDEREHEHEEGLFSDAGSSSGRRRAPPPPPPPPRRSAAPSAGMAAGLASGVDGSAADIAAGDASRAMLANVKSASQLEEDGRSHVLRHLLR